MKVKHGYMVTLSNKKTGMNAPYVTVHAENIEEALKKALEYAKAECENVKVVGIACNNQIVID